MVGGCRQVDLNDVDVVPPVDLDGQLGHPVGHDCEADDIACDVLVYHEDDSSVACDASFPVQVAAVVVEVEGEASFPFSPCFADSDDVKRYTEQLLFKFQYSVV